MFKLNSKQQVNLNKILNKHKLELLLLHGSQVTKQTHEDSDIDIAFYSKANKKIEQLELLADLHRVLKTDRIDTTNLNKANPLLLKSIINKSVLLSGKKADFDKLQLRAFHRYNDYLPYLKMEKEFVKSQLNTN